MLKSICTAKETISERKRQPSEWKKILAKEIPTKNLCPIHTNNLHSSILKNPIKISQWSKCTFLQRCHRDSHKAQEKMLSITSSQRKVAQTHSRHHFTLIRMA